MGRDLTREAVGFAAGAVSAIIFGGGAIYLHNGRKTGTRFLFAGDSYLEYRERIKREVALDVKSGTTARTSRDVAEKAVQDGGKVYGLKNHNGKIVKGNDNEFVNFADFAKLVRDEGKFGAYSEDERGDVWAAYHNNVRKKFGEICAEKLYQEVSN